MRQIQSQEIEKAVAGVCLEASSVLPLDVLQALEQARANERSEVGQQILDDILQNASIAKDDKLPICQDTGLALIFVDLGQEVQIVGESLEAAINQGVRQGYKEGYLRKSVVADPLFDRLNTTDNTPAIIHLRMVPGNKIYLTLAPKGGGCENKSFLRMLVPADGVDGVKQTVLDAVKAAGASACPPFVIGVGIGGNSEVAMLNAKRATLRNLNSKHSDPRYACLEDELLCLINASGIGPLGLGGVVTALKVNIEIAPAHIASLPVAVSIGCHAARHASIEI